MPYHYTTGARERAFGRVSSFEFYRFRFRFQAEEPLELPAGGSANVVRGALGTLLQRVAPREVYQRLFEPKQGSGGGPSGLADEPRPFVLRSAHLDGAAIAAGENFFFDAHVFELRQPVLDHLQAAFAELAMAGIGPRRARARLEAAESLDLQGQAGSGESVLCRVPLDPDTAVWNSCTLRFVTPTELKTGGAIAARPEFGVLFARLRDRICTLRALYGAGALKLDFRGMGERASQVTLGRCDLRWENLTRRSSRTGQTHPLGGFVGEAEYQGVLAEFLPWLRAARWVGVGRQAVWGKGEMHVIAESAAAANINHR